MNDSLSLNVVDAVLRETVDRLETLIVRGDICDPEDVEATRKWQLRASNARSSIRRIKKEFRIAQAVVQVRTKMHPRGPRPDRFCKRGVCGAFDSGYESAWRGQRYNNPYVRPDAMAAYLEGFNRGAMDSERDIEAAMKGSVPETPKSSVEQKNGEGLSA